LTVLPWTSQTKHIHSLLAADNHLTFRTFVIASVAGIYSLFPLLFTPAGRIKSYLHRNEPVLTRLLAESLIKVVYSALWAFFVFQPLTKIIYR
jgi:alpha-1,3-glucosyltransferase